MALPMYMFALGNCMHDVDASVNLIYAGITTGMIVAIAP